MYMRCVSTIRKAYFEFGITTSTHNLYINLASQRAEV